MNEIISVNYNNENPTVSARELHSFLEIETPFRIWFPRMKEYGFSDGIDYTPYIFVHPQNKQEVTDYSVTIDMAKEICMLQRNEKGKQARQYFIQLEKDWNSPEKVMARALQIADKKIKELTIKIELDAPKVEFYDAVADSKTAVQMGDVAKAIGKRGYGRNKIFQILRDKKVLMRDNTPYQKYVDRGYFRVIEQKFTKPDGEVCVSIKTLVYQKGIDFIRKIIG